MIQTRSRISVIFVVRHSHVHLDLLVSYQFKYFFASVAFYIPIKGFKLFSHLVH